MTLPATDGFWDKVLALLTYDASSPLIFSSAAFSAQSSMDKYTMSDKSRPPSYMGWS